MSIKNGSKLEQIEQFLQEVVGKQLALELKLTTRIDQSTLKYVKGNPFLQSCTSKTQAKPLGCLVYCEKFSNEYEPVTIGQWIKWHSNIPELNARWSSLYDFFVEVNACGQELQNKAIEKIQEESKTSTPMNDLIEGRSIVTKWGMFSTRTRANREASAVEKEFVWDKLAIVKSSEEEADDGQLYWKFNDGYRMVPLQTRANQTLEIDPTDYGFWKRWWDENREMVYQYEQEILNTLSRYYIQKKNRNNNVLDLEYTSEDKNTLIYDKDVESLIFEKCPRCIMNALNFGHRMIDDGGKNLIPTCVFISALKKTETFKVTQMEENDWTSVLSKTLLMYVDKEKLKRIKIFSNKSEGGVYNLGAVPVPREFNTPPTLDTCPTWKMFLTNKFPSPKMSLLRLARFVLSILDSNDFSRQILLCLGPGGDGKSTMIDSIGEMFGKFSQSTSIDNCIDNNFGLSTCINKRFIIIGDTAQANKSVQRFFENSKIKQITGSGSETASLQVDIKNKNPISWYPSGAKIAVVSNATRLFLNGEAMTSRISPLYFEKNFTRKQEIAQNVLQERLVSEKAHFLQWCMDYYHYYTTLKNVKGETNLLHLPNRVAIVTDQQFDDWYNGKEDNVFSDNLEDIQIKRYTKEAFEVSTTGSKSSLPVLNIRYNEQDEGLDELDTEWDDALDVLFKQDDNGFISFNEIKQALLYIKMNEKKCGLSTKDYTILSSTGILDLNYKQITYSSLYRIFLDKLRTKFNSEKTTKRVNGKVVKGLKGMKLITLLGFNDEETNDNQENNEMELNFV